MRRPVLAMCAALAALALPVSATGTALAADGGASQSNDRGHGGPGQPGGPDPKAAHGTAARVKAQSRKQVVSRRAKRAATDTPLTLTIDQLTPSTIPAQGVIHVSGSITNNDTSTWSTINVYPFISDEPMANAAQLRAAAASDPAEFVGQRITEGNYHDTIATLAPGEQERFSFSIPRRALKDSQGLKIHAPGVYWFGVHALGEGPEGRDENADGRARTFLPLVPDTAIGRLPTALVIPIRRPIAYDDDGSLTNLTGWIQSLEPGGRLRSLVDFGAGAGDLTVNWVVDPAVVDAVRQLAAGNPPRSLAANLAAGQDDGEPDSTASATPSTGSADVSDGASQSPSGSAPPSSTATSPPSGASETNPPTDAANPLDLRNLDPQVSVAAEAAQAWLGRLQAAIGPGDGLYALPYGDTDVSGAARHDPKLYAAARARSDAATILPGLTARPIVGSPSGYLSSRGLALVDPDTDVLVTDHAFADPPPAVATTDGHRLAVTSTGAVSGGPGPDDPLSMTAMRQRLLAEAAVRFLHHDRAPLFVQLPHDWSPGSPSAYFPGLDVPWLDLTTVDDATDQATPSAVQPTEIRYPEIQSQQELDAANFSSADQLVAAGAALQSMLTLNNVVSGAVTDEALATTSYSARTRADASRADADRSRDWIESRLAAVHVAAPQAVTLSSSSGRFGTTIINTLDEPVTVSLGSQSGDDKLRIAGPRRVDVAAGGHQSVLLTARTGENGVHDVTLLVTDKRGVPLGGSTRISIRSAQVSNVIWLFLGIGLALLFGTIAVRLFRRIRAARRQARHGEGQTRSEVPSAGAKQPAEAGSR